MAAALDRIRNGGVTLNREKCEFEKNKLRFLGHVIDHQGIQADPEKTSATQRLNSPNNTTELRRFLGMANQFSPNLAQAAQPLRELLSKNRTWQWGQMQEKAFQLVKAELCNLTVLAFYTSDAPTKLSASSHGLGAVLLQKTGGEWKLVCIRITIYVRYRKTTTFQGILRLSKLKSTSSKAVIEAVKAVFSRHGIPETVRSNNGPQFSSDEFARFAADYGFWHTTSSPKSGKARRNRHELNIMPCLDGKTLEPPGPELEQALPESQLEQPQQEGERLPGKAPDGFDAVSVQNVGSTYIIVSWDLPTHSNGILINFSLYCNGALAGVLPLTVISYNTTGLLPFTLYMYITLSVGQVLQSRPQALHSSWNVVLGVVSVLQPACPGLYRSDGKRPDGITTVPWKCGQLLVWDATCPDTFAPSYSTIAAQQVGAVAQQAEDKKTQKYKHLSSHLFFTPVAIETSGVYGQ
ncbi:hypothetical protein EMCRGX_G004842 [Ephydatia muelleri]